MNKEKILIVGAGGHTRSLINILNNISENILGIIDENYIPDHEEYIGKYKVIGSLNKITSKIKLILSIGDNKKRQELYENRTNLIVEKNLIHRSTTIEDNIELGKSNQIFSQVVINSYCKVGDNNIINTKSLIEHETIIGNHNHISVGSIICGRVIIGNQCFIGAGSVIIDGINICNDVIVGANSVVIKDIIEKGIYVGNPVRKIK